MNIQLYILLIILSIIWSVLCIALFFKIWGMTNDVEEIKNILKGIACGISPQQAQPGREESPVQNSETRQEEESLEKGNGSANFGLVPIFIAIILSVLIIFIIAFSAAK